MLKNQTGSRLDQQTHVRTDLATQATISVVLGLSAFLTFCFLRPRWTALYAARKRQKNDAAKLPDLPDTAFGWIPVLYRITEDEVLASAGLDAFVFLAFFKMAIKYLAFVLFFCLTVIYPVHKNFDTSDNLPDLPPATNATFLGLGTLSERRTFEDQKYKNSTDYDLGDLMSTDYLWIYVIFVYLFSIAAMYLIVNETKRIIRIRQTYLGTHSSVTDRTIRLSGIPRHLRSEEKIKETIEELEIGKVESVMLCREWKELDDLLKERMSVLRKLEEAWTAHLGFHRPKTLERLPRERRRETAIEDDDDEQSGLLGDVNGVQEHVTSYAHDRPTTRIWFGFMNLQSRSIDAINYYEEKLRKLDDKIREARKKKYPPTPLAFVTLDSIAACQMAVQAIIDPEPMQLMVNSSPAPADVVWKNTYLSRTNRMTRAWTITAIVTLLTVVWWFLLIAIAALLNLATIRKVSPALADALERHEIVRSLVQTGLPTLVISLLNVIVPYLYEWLSNLQGMISQGDVEMSIISKNYFFTFFNLFVVFTVFGTVSNIFEARDLLGEQLRDLSRISWVLAKALGKLAPFYMNLIILQGLGLFPFRLLEFGAVSLYPVYLMGAKTPRDYAELVQPPMFSYGFFLPQTLFIFIVCIVYSILPKGELVTLFGLIYFIIGSFIYKYQLLYAMDHRKHSTGRAWSIICHRVIVGLLVFQLAMAGQLALLTAIKRSLLVIPLLAGTIWFGYFYRRSYDPLMRFIALRSLHRDDDAEVISLSQSRFDNDTNEGQVVDTSERTGLRFINPSLILPLEDVWVSKKRANAILPTTSFPILLPRGIAFPSTPPPQPSPDLTVPLVSLFENSSLQILTLGSPPRSICLRYVHSPSTHTFQYLTLTEDFSLTTTNLTPVQHFKATPASVWQHSAMTSHPSATHVRWTLQVTDNSAESSLNSPLSHHSIDFTPLRSRARSPSPPPRRGTNTSSSSSTDDSTSGTVSPSSDSESPVRGRSLLLDPHHNHNLISRATARRRAGPSSMDASHNVNFHIARSPTPYLVPHVKSSASEKTIIEPLRGAGTSSSLVPGRPSQAPTFGDTFRLSQASTWEVGLDLSRFRGHRDTFALLDLAGLAVPRRELPREVWACLSPYLDLHAYAALRLTCKSWCRGVTAAWPLEERGSGGQRFLSCRDELSLAQRLPAEVVQMVYWQLEPREFDAARRACRAWMVAGLERGLLEEMCKRGGWGGCVLADRAARRGMITVGTTEEWWLSKRLATECSIAHGWKGNGLDGSGGDEMGVAQWDGPSEQPESTTSARISSMRLASHTDFSDLSSGYSAGSDTGAALHFTVSVCGKFVLVVEGCLIYIYRLYGPERSASIHVGFLQPFTSVICPKRVLAVSMDASSQRYAVAALLDDRMGLVCDLDLARFARSRPDESRVGTWEMEEQTVRSICAHGLGGRDPSVSPLKQDQSSQVAYPQVRQITYDTPPPATDTTPDLFLLTKNSFSSGIPTETGPRYIYRSLCSAEDPPLSVAICPQRRCVAFGCTSGIELHWVDALTGQDLNRWFPLTAPSDFLYFLPPRKGVDSGKKLRLIASAGSEEQKGSLRSPFGGKCRTGEGIDGFGDKGRGSKHYKAVPLGDGQMVLFTDPESGMLGLGGDTANRGPTNLERKVVFEGPTGVLPTVYAAGGELRWGVRLAVGYGERVWLFCVPPDVLIGEGRGGSKPTCEVSCQKGPAQPLRIRGLEIGSLEGLVDLAVDSSCGSLTVWAFAAGGMASTWQIDNGRQSRVRKRAVLRNGPVVDLEDSDGDVVMRDAPPLRSDGYDGAASLFLSEQSDTASTSRFEGLTAANERYIETVYDVEMRDDDEGYWSGDESGPGRGSFAIHVPPLNGRWLLEEADWDWDVDLLGVRTGGVGAADVLEMSRLECEVL
ncbi:hypothetical protein MMC18_003999 [Xylographa bjoerkii]|nr:hypothetical protein [Xylographa bjoerkii]